MLGETRVLIGIECGYKNGMKHNLFIEVYESEIRLDLVVFTSDPMDFGSELIKATDKIWSWSEVISLIHVFKPSIIKIQDGIPRISQ